MEARIDFTQIDWLEWMELGTARMKIALVPGTKLRLIEFPPGFEQISWCESGHIGYVVEGVMETIIEAFLLVVFVVLVAPIMWASHTLFLMRLLLGRTIDWGPQMRDDHAIPWSLAFRRFWPQTLIGLAPTLLLAAAAPEALPYALLIAGGPLVSIPLAVVTASPAVGRALVAMGIDRLPEELVPPPELRALKLPAVERVQRR